ncbi:type I restriction endonuclease subunit R [Mycoplasma parvum]|uniref:type I restriction endonuclease subunit R n=1 Tax=Mycoplasma parvum TaxID=984991 RepID=UPI000418FACE|nr:HsdR family type I site-specific deoxyribonuclease [Mycoplasma parvum]
MSQFNEKELTEISALQELEKLGWNWKKANEICRKSEKSVLSYEELRNSLKKLNSWINEEQIKEAIQRLERGTDQDFSLSLNKEKYYLIRDGIDVTVKDKGINSTRRAKVVDFKYPENNSFTVVDQLGIKNAGNTEYSCRTDLVGFVNGIPLLFVEFKAHYISVEEGYTKNYKKYLKQIPQLFAYNAFCVFSNGRETKVGAVGSEYEFFNDWNRLKEEDIGNTDISIFLRGACNKQNFLDLFENFILFSKSNETIYKVIARNHQFLGVNKAFENYKNRKNNDGLIGTFWHTQGSGKSLSMLFLAEKIKRKCEGLSPLFIILLDRKELENQIYDTFLSFGVLGANLNCKIDSKKELEEKIKENHSYVFSLIHKFLQYSTTPINTEKEIVIIVDEAHRSQYGKMSVAMYRFLPKASRIGFTATPLFKHEEITAKHFGDYISIYDFTKAINDGITVDLIFLNRACKVKDIENPQINEDFYLFREKNELPKDWKSNKYLWMNENRLRNNAKDFVSFYSERFFDWEEAILSSSKESSSKESSSKESSSKESSSFIGKALYVCFNRRACILMKNFVKEYWDKEIQKLEESLIHYIDEEKEKLNMRIKKMKETEMEVVFSNGDLREEEIYECYGDDIEIPGEKSDSDLRKIENNFKNKKHKLRIVFVCAMWLTGFDVKCLTFLFLDKALEAHTLMQAIARPNRKDVGKDRAFIIDYLNCLAAFKKALSTWGVSRNSILSATKKPEEIIDEISELVLKIEQFLNKYEISLKNLLIEQNKELKREMLREFKEKLLKDHIRSEFNAYCLKLFNELKYVVKSQLSEKIYDKSTAIRAIYNHLNATKEIKGSRNCDANIFQILKQYLIVGENEENLLKDMSNIEIKKVSSFVIYKSNRKETIFEDLKNRIFKKTQEVLDKNPTLINFFNEYNKLIEKWNQSIEPTELEKVFNDMLELSKQVWKEDDRYKEEGFEHVSELTLSDISKKTISNSEKEEVDSESIKTFSKKVFRKFNDYSQEVDNPFEKEVTSSEIKTILKNIIFAEFPIALNSEKTNILRDSFFNYLKESFNKKWFFKSKHFERKGL